MVMQHHALEYHVEKDVCYLQSQGHSEGLFDIYWTADSLATKPGLMLVISS